MLSTRFAESIFYLHAQPPLLNVLAGFLLWLQYQTSIPAEIWGALWHFVLGGLIVVGFLFLASKLIQIKWVKAFVMALVLFNPMFYSFLFLFFYPTYELLALTMLFLGAYLYFERGNLRFYVGACGTVGALVYTRSLFHPTWAMLTIVFITGYGWYLLRFPKTRKQTVVIMITIIFLVAWPIKNYLLFGISGYSSWQGYNLIQGLAQKTPSISDYVNHNQTAYNLPSHYQDIPVLAQPVKSNGSVNWNHHMVIAYGQELQQQAVQIMKNRPLLLAEKAWHNYQYGYASYSGRNPYEGNLDRRSTDTIPRYYWVRGYEIAVFQYWGNDIRLRPYNGFMFWFPMALTAVAWQWQQIRKRQSVAFGIIPLILFCILWALVSILFIDGAEGNRMRFATEPFTLLLIGWWLSQQLSSSKNRCHNSD
ncbi:MAG: hypothetical protein GY805_30765 [Chloroflexi bacterium]|nr:hypothetical protein [Chloroflexota bacterium]